MEPTDTIPQHHQGQIQIILGPMFSGKSTELIRRIRRFTISQRKCVVVKYEKDNRYTEEGEVKTHDAATWNAVPCVRLCDIEEYGRSFDVIGIDEGQFYPDVVDFSERMASIGKIVIIAALDGTFQRLPFNSVLELIPLAEKVDKLTAVCHLCHEEASFTARLSNETQIEIIGGLDKYVACCRRCYYIRTEKHIDKPN